MKLNHHSLGTTLVISLILLFVITLLGINSIRNSQLQEKMSHHSQDKIISFAASESAAIFAENLVTELEEEPTITSTSSCPNTITPSGNSFCIVDYNHILLPEIQTNAWWASNGQEHTINYPSSVATNARVIESPRFYIEYIHFASDSLVIGKEAPSGMHYYRIFSRGNGATDKSSTFIETTYRRRY